MHDARVILRVDIQRRRVRHQRVTLLGNFERRVHLTLGSGEPHQRSVVVRRGERQEVVRVDGDLRMLLRQELERGLAQGLPRSARRREFESDARRCQIDRYHVHAQRTRSGLRPFDISDAAKRVLYGVGGREAPAPDRDQKPSCEFRHSPCAPWRAFIL